MDTGWLHRRRADVPAGELWLGPRERAVAARLVIDKRRQDWRLGRFTAKAALAAWLGVAPERIEILAAADGAPEAWLDGTRVPVSVSLSHRGDRALAAVTAAGADGGAATGCDLELIEPRSDAFIADWLSLSEQRAVRSCHAGDQPLLANLLWSAKEAASKVRRLGLVLDVRHAVVTVHGFERHDRWAGATAWRALRVDWDDHAHSPTFGWWRADDDHVMVVAGEPAPRAPRWLSAPRELPVLA